MYLAVQLQKQKHMNKKAQFMVMFCGTLAVANAQFGDSMPSAERANRVKRTYAFCPQIRTSTTTGLLTVDD
jgi:hypothetical protein